MRGGAGTDGSLAGVYRSTWAAAEPALRTGRYQPDVRPVDGSPRWGISVVIGIDGPVRDRLAGVLADLCVLRRSPHLVYRPAHLHCTVRSLEGHQRQIPPARVRLHAGRLAEAAAGLPPVRLRLRGLGGSPGGLFACGYPGPALPALRTRLRDTSDHAGVPGGDAGRVRDTAHVSLLVFTGPVVAEPDLLDYVAAHRDTDYGVLDARWLSLVRYTWVPDPDTGGTGSTVSMTELARVPLVEPAHGVGVMSRSAPEPTPAEASIQHPRADACGGGQSAPEASGWGRRAGQSLGEEL